MQYNIVGRSVEIQNPILFDRLSQEESINNGSHLIHQKRLKNFCASNGIEIAKENEYYFDAVQGDAIQYTTRFQELIIKVKKGLCDSIIAIHPDRLSRDAFLSLGILKIVEETRTVLIFIDFPQLNVLDPMGRRVYVDMAVKAENEKLDDVRRSIGNSLEYMKDGFSVGGQAPYGFEKEIIKIVGRENPHKKLRVDPNLSENVVLIFDLFLKLKRIKTVAKELNKLNIVSPEGGKWAASTIKRILRNPIYMGTWVRNTHKQIKRPEKLLEGKKGVYWKLKEESDWITIERDDPIVSKEKWETAKDILDNINYRKTKKKMVFLFAGMECSFCGNKMFGHRHEKNKVTQLRKGKSKYRCKNDLEPHCSHSIDVDLFDTTIMDGLKDLSENTRFLESLEKSCEEQICKKGLLIENIEQMNKETERQEKVIEVYTEHIVDGTLKPSTAKIKIKEADEKKEELKEQIRAANSELGKIVTFNDYASFIGVDLRKVVKSLYLFGKEVQRDILKLLIHKISVYQDKIVCQLNYIPRLTEKIGTPSIGIGVLAPIGAPSSFFGQVYNGDHSHRGATTILHHTPKMPITVEFPIKMPLPAGYPISIQSLKDTIRKARLDKKHTQREASNEMGVDACTLRLWEHGATNPTPKNWAAIKKYVPSGELESTAIMIDAKPFTLKDVANVCNISHWTLIDWIDKSRIARPEQDPNTNHFIFSQRELDSVKVLAKEREMFLKK